MNTTPTPAKTPQSLPPSQTTQEGIVLNEQSDARNRDRIALGVLIFSIVAVLFISIVVVNTAKEGADRQMVSQRVMDSTLPLYGTWVGTILAFYFSRNAFEAASNTTARNATVFQKVSSGLVSVPPPPDNTLAKIPLKSLANGLVFRQDDLNKPLEDVVNELDSRSRYRTIVVDAEKKYVDLVYRIDASAFLRQPQPEGSNQQGEQRADPAPSTPTLKEYIDWRNDEGGKPTVVFLPERATLADADAKLKETMGCRDVIVTTDGKDTSPVVVYVTDNDINEYKGAADISTK